MIIGIRLLQGQGHENNGDLDLCHTSWCVYVLSHNGRSTVTLTPILSSSGLLNGGSLTDYLTEVKAWLDDNPNEGILVDQCLEY